MSREFRPPAYESWELLFAPAVEEVLGELRAEPEIQDVVRVALPLRLLRVVEGTVAAASAVGASLIYLPGRQLNLDFIDCLDSQPEIIMRLALALFAAYRRRDKPQDFLAWLHREVNQYSLRGLQLPKVAALAAQYGITDDSARAMLSMERKRRRDLLKKWGRELQAHWITLGTPADRAADYLAAYVKSDWPSQLT